MTKLKKSTYNTINYTSLFCSGGVGETYLKEIGLISTVSNEIVKKRADFYKAMYPQTNMVCGDITDSAVFEELVRLHKKNHNQGVLASPVCRDFSLANTKRNPNSKRAHLYEYVLKFVERTKPTFVLIENSDQMMHVVVDGQIVALRIVDALKAMKYHVSYGVQDCANFDTPQHRRRTIILAHKTKEWKLPTPSMKIITLEEAIGDLPPLEIGQKSKFKWHDATMFNWSKDQINLMRHVPSGLSARAVGLTPMTKSGMVSNAVFDCAFARRRWDDACNTILQDSTSISGFRNCHPGRLMKNGLYSDARPFTILELLRVEGLPDNWPIPDWATDRLIRQLIGESFAPKHVLACFKTLPR